MKIMISPAKKMNVDTDSFDCQGLPFFLDRAQLLLSALQAMSQDEAARPFGKQRIPGTVKTPTGCGKPTCVPISLRQFSPMKAFSTSIWRRACLLMTSWIISRNTCGFFPAFTACSAPLTAWRLTGWKCRPNWRWLAPATCTLSGAIPWPLRLPKIPT